jgi:hypothetical protein
VTILAHSENLLCDIKLFSEPKKSALLNCGIDKVGVAIYSDQQNRPTKPSTLGDCFHSICHNIFLCE